MTTYITGVSLWIALNNDALDEVFDGPPPLGPGDHLPGIDAHIDEEWDSSDLGIYVNPADEGWRGMTLDAIVARVRRTFDVWIDELVAEQQQEEQP